MKWNKRFTRELVKLGLITSCFMSTVGMQIFASSSCELVDGVRNYKGEKVWDEEDSAPTLRVELKDAYKLKGKQETFFLDLNNAEWAEAKNTTLYISKAEGIQNYDGYIYTSTNSKAEVTINIPNTIEENDKIIIEIPLFIKIRDEVEEVSVSVTEKKKDEGIVEDTKIAIATTTDKKMSWHIGDIPTIGDGETIAPIYFEETQAGILGSREIEFYIYLKSEGIKFDEPEHLSKTENKDDIDYTLKLDDYIEYAGGFSKNSQQLKVAISKSGKSMRVKMSGSIPSERGIIILKNLPVVSTSKDVSKQDVKISLQCDDFMDNNGEAIVAHYIPGKKVVNENANGASEDTSVEITQDENTSQDTKEEPMGAPKVSIVFKVGDEHYSIDGINHVMDGKTFVQEPGYTMVPVRYVAEALGVTDIKVKEKKVTFSYEDKAIELTIGSTQAMVNKEVIVLPVTLQAKEGRIYAPMGEIANLLGLNKSWDAQNKSAVFTK